MMIISTLNLAVLFKTYRRQKQSFSSFSFNHTLFIIYFICIQFRLIGNKIVTKYIPKLMKLNISIPSFNSYIHIFLAFFFFNGKHCHHQSIQRGTGVNASSIKQVNEYGERRSFFFSHFVSAIFCVSTKIL